MEKDIRDLTLDMIKKELIDLGEKPFRAKQIFRWISQGVDNFSKMTDLSKTLREKLTLKFYIDNIYISDCLISEVDKTRKYIFELKDGNVIESVIMYYKHGITACISSQVGCKMGCKFCASTYAGFDRNLNAGEMVGQVLKMQEDIGQRISNIVLMGIGEPLDNFENVDKFLDIVNHPDGLNIGLRHISISTCGIVPGIKALMTKRPQVTLSISLHATTNERRSGVMPINNKYNIQELMTVCRQYSNSTKRRISFEYALIKGVNDDKGDALRLAKMLKGMLAHVNIIPINEVSSSELKRTDRLNVERFKNILLENGLSATIRRELGSDISAACGQLRRKRVEKKSGS